MKKLITMVAVALIAFAAFAVPTGSNDHNDANWTDLSYIDAPVLKVLDSNEAFVVIYQKEKLGSASTIIPKKWIFGTKDAPRKLRLRFLGKGKLGPQLTVVKKAGEFKSVILTVPKSKGNPTWGVVPSGAKLEGVDKDTLEELDL